MYTLQKKYRTAQKKYRKLQKKSKEASRAKAKADLSAKQKRTRSVVAPTPAQPPAPPVVETTETQTIDWVDDQVSC